MLFRITNIFYGTDSVSNSNNSSTLSQWSFFEKLKKKKIINICELLFTRFTRLQALTYISTVFSYFVCKMEVRQIMPHENSNRQRLKIWSACLIYKNSSFTIIFETLFFVISSRILPQSPLFLSLSHFSKYWLGI